MRSLLAKLSGWSRRQSRRFSALDFDSRQVRIVQAEESGGGVVCISKLATADMPEGIDLTDAQAVGEFLGRTLDQMHLRNTNVILSVPRGQAILKPLILPVAATTSELAGMVQYQAEKELTFRPGEAVIDFTLESHYGAEPSSEQAAEEGEHVLVAAVRRPVIEFYQKVAEVAGVRMLRLGLRPYANLRCIEVYVPQETHGRVALVHVTADEAEVDVMADGALTFSRSAVLKVPGPGAEAPAVREAVAALVMEVARSLHSYLGVEGGHGIDVILVAGGTGIEAQVVEDVGRRLGVRCERLNPAAALGLEEGGPEASAFISALGLAHGQTGEVRVPFDFLNPKRPVVRRDMRKILAAAVAAGLGIVLAAIVTGAALHRYSASARAEVLRDQFKELTDENRKVSALAKRAETVDSWVRSGRGWLEQWAYLSAVFPSCAEVYVTNLKTNPDGSVSFNVRAKSNEAINDLGRRLSAAGYDFKPGQVTTGTDPFGYTYGTTVKVVVKPDMKIDLASAAPAPRPEDDTSAAQFGKPAPTATAAAPPAAASNSQGMPGPDAPYSVRLKAWTNRYEAINRERPPESSPDYQEWRARREALRAEYPKPPMSGSSSSKHR